MFFGREGQSDEVLEKLANNRFVGVIGTSGSGKSSLMYCGVIPILYGGFLTNSGSDWNVVPTRPGNSPIDNLAEAILISEEGYSELSEEDKQLKKTLYSAILRTSSYGLVDLVKKVKRKKGENLLVLVDQFEELFRFKKSTKDTTSYNESVAFVKLLLEAISDPEVSIYVVLTMRSDFIGDCAQYPELTKLINDSHYLIPQMTREDMRDAIVGPIAVGGGEISSNLVQKVLNDAGDNQDLLPILQHAMMRTWDYWSSSNDGEKRLDIHHYEAIGQLDSALSLHANETYDELDENGKKVCENIFKCLTEKGADNRGIRHPTAVNRIAQISKSNPADVIQVVDRFRAVGRSFVSPGPHVGLSEETIIDISHESLMRIWDRLKVWVDEEASSVQMYLRLSDASNLYQLGRTGLWRPPDLQLATNWRDKKEPTLAWAERHNPAFEKTMVFLETSDKVYKSEEQNKIRLQKRALRRSRAFALILGSLLFVSLGVMLYAFQLKNKADQQTEVAIQKEREAELARAEAEVARAEAEVAKEEAEKNQKLAELAKLEAQAQREQADLARIEAEEQKEIAEAQKQIAEKQTLIAEKAKNNAIKQEKLAKLAQTQAEASTQEALRQKDRADEALEDGYKLRMIAIAKAMAIKSVIIKKDTSQKANMSLKAYQFNKKYEGNQFDGDVYDGLYYTIKALNPENFNSLEGHTNAVRSLVFDSNKKLYSTGSDGSILSWDCNVEGSPDSTFIYNSGNINRQLVLDPTETKLAICGDVNFVEVIDLNKPSDKPIRLNGHTKMVWDASFIPNMNQLITCSGDSTVRKWNLDSLTSEVIIKSDSRIRKLNILGNDVYYITQSGKLIRSSLDGDNSKTVFDNEYSLTSLTINKEGTQIAFGDLLGHMWVMNAQTLEIITAHSIQNSRINHLKFSNNSELLASASFDGSVNVYKTDNYDQQPIVMKDHESWVWGVAFSPDDDRIIAGCVDNLIRVWPTDMDKMANGICSNMKRNFSKKEWKRFVAKDITYEKTCEDMPLGENVVEEDLVKKDRNE